MYIVIGFMFGLSFSFRANNIGVPVLVALLIPIFEMSRGRFRSAVWETMLVAFGFLLPVLSSVFYFWKQNALNEFVHGAFLYNVGDVSLEPDSTLDLTAGFRVKKLWWVAWIALAGYGVSIYRWARIWFRDRSIPYFELFLILLFPVEIYLTSLSGRNYRHYYISWTLSVGLFSGILFYEFMHLALHPRVVEFLDGDRGGILMTLMLLLTLVVYHSTINEYRIAISKVLFDRSSGIEYVDPVSKYVSRNTEADDTVLTWVPEAWINFSSRRDSPVRLVFYPLFAPGTITEEQGRGYYEDLIAHHPALILDCVTQQDAAPSLDPKIRELQVRTLDKLYMPPYIESVFTYISMNYHFEAVVDNCTVYRSNH